jgi:hypothetical protein
MSITRSKLKPLRRDRELLDYFLEVLRHGKQEAEVREYEPPAVMVKMVPQVRARFVGANLGQP